MSARSDRSSGSLPSKPPALISMPTSSPTPLTVAVTAPPATVPSTVVSASRACALASCSCICWACWSRAFMSKPPPPSASNGFWLIGSPLGRSGGASLVPDLLDHLRPELALEQLGGADALVVGVDVVGVRLGVGVGPLRTGGLRRLVGRPGLLDRLARGGDGALVGLGLAGRRRRGRLGVPGRRGLGRGGRRRGRLGDRGPGDRGRALRGGTRVDDRLDLPAGADDVDRRLVEHLVAAGAHERVARARVGEAEGQGV